MATKPLGILSRRPFCTRSFCFCNIRHFPNRTVSRCWPRPPVVPAGVCSCSCLRLSCPQLPAQLLGPEPCRRRGQRPSRDSPALQHFAGKKSFCLYQHIH